MSGAILSGAPSASFSQRSLRLVEMRFALLALFAVLITVASYQLSLRVSALGLWPDGTAALAGRAALSAAGKADPTALLAGYPPLPYVLLLIGDLLARPLGLDPVALIDAMLLGGFAARYGRSLASRGASTTTVVIFVILLSLNPLSVEAVAQGPQALLLVWGGWVLTRGMIDTRTITGINDTIALTLALPMLAMTSAQGMVIALCTIPFLFLAVPRDLAERNYTATYLVLLFPLVFCILCLLAISTILLHAPISVMIWGAYHTVQPDPLGEGASAALAPIATAGVGLIAVRLSLTRAVPRALRESTTAALSSLMLASILVLALGIACHASEFLIPVLGMTAAISTRWPIANIRHAGWLLLAGALVAGLVLLIANTQTFGPLGRLVTGRPGAISADRALGQYLAARQDVMIDALAHPAVVAERGKADGLITDRSPVFGVSVIAHHVFAPAIAVRAHRPGETDDEISRSLPHLFERGAPGYRLAFDQDGWRVWTRVKNSENL